MLHIHNTHHTLPHNTRPHKRFEAARLAPHCPSPLWSLRPEEAEVPFSPAEAGPLQLGCSALCSGDKGGGSHGGRASLSGLRPSADLPLVNRTFLFYTLGSTWVRFYLNKRSKFYCVDHPLPFFFILAVLGLHCLAGFSLVAAGGGLLPSCGARAPQRSGFYGRGARALGTWLGFQVVQCGLSSSSACGIFEDQGSNPCLCTGRQILYL